MNYNSACNGVIIAVVARTRRNTDSAGSEAIKTTPRWCETHREHSTIEHCRISCVKLSRERERDKYGTFSERGTGCVSHVRSVIFDHPTLAEISYWLRRHLSYSRKAVYH
jgi:hypothetical protein